MKFSTSLILLLVVAGGSYAAFTVPWSTLDGGGGKSTGTSSSGIVYSLTGTIGQFDATTTSMSGGSFSMNGGFWAQLVPSVQPDYPDLTIARLPNGDASIQWQSDATGWQLETSTDLEDWDNLGNPITTAGVLTVTPSPGVPKKFFRLKNP